MKLSTAGLVAIALASATPALAQPQPTTTPDQQQADQELNQQREAMRAAYASRDQKRIAAERERLRAAYHRDWTADHPPAAAEVARVDRWLAQARENNRLARASHDPARIAAAQAELREASHADWEVHHFRR